MSSKMNCRSSGLIGRYFCWWINHIPWIWLMRFKIIKESLSDRLVRCLLESVRAASPDQKAIDLISDLHNRINRIDICVSVTTRYVNWILKVLKWQIHLWQLCRH